MDYLTGRAIDALQVACERGEEDMTYDQSWSNALTASDLEWISSMAELLCARCRAVAQERS